MKIFTRVALLLLAFMTVFAGQTVKAQLVMNPTDSVYTYDSTKAKGTPVNPNLPASGKIGKWIRTVRMSWNTNEYKAYMFNGSAFRIHFPHSYNPTANDGKRYPIIIFYCGDGEEAGIYDNEDQLAHGAQPFMTAIDAGTFDGYAIFMQSQYGWGQAQWLNYQTLIDSLVVGYKGDPYRVTQNGLSGGGQGIWNHLAYNPTYFAGSVPMSATLTNDGTQAVINLVKFIPIWNLDGGLDNDPPPSLAYLVQDSMLKYGANYTLYEYPTEGHDTWDSTWLQPNWWPYCNNVYQSNPWPLYGRTNFCPGQTINVTLGVIGGLQGYQWRKNGVAIAGATSNTLVVTSAGTYDVSIERSNYYWSNYSPKPVVITVQAATQTPPITTLKGASPVLPDAAGDTSVTLTLPAGDSLYTWQYLPTGAVVGTSQNLVVGASKTGDYIASIIPYQGCSSIPSPAFPVVKASGPNAPPAATNLVAIGTSFTTVRLTWAANPNPANMQTAFEIYRGTKSGSYSYLLSVNPDSLGYTDPTVSPGATYFYAIRAIDTTGAAALSNVAKVTTTGDITPPTAPGNLTVVSSTTSSVGLTWTASTDNVSVNHYAIYVNGVLTNVTQNLSFLVNALTANKLYSFYVKAVDGSGNYSSQSNQVDAPAINNGLNYSFYTTATAWNDLPTFSTLTPVMTGQMPNVSIANATQTTNFGYIWTGYIHIPVAGTYTFQTASDDGSAMWFNTLTPTSTSTATVDNDGQHGVVTVNSAALNLQPGYYPIVVEYFQGGGGYSMAFSWSCPQLFGNSSFVPVANQYFAGNYTPAGTPPAYPTVVKAQAVSYNKVNLTWVDNSNNETGFEVYRGTTSSGPWQIVKTTPANTTAYSDSIGLVASTQYYYKVQAIDQYGGSGYDTASIGGISYNFYQGLFDPLYNYDSAATPIVSSGVMPNISLTPAGSVTTDFGFLFAGRITIPVSGTWTFYTSSDDASELFINGYSMSHIIVNNNYQQGMTQRSGTIYLAAGTYPFYVAYEQSGGGFGLSVSWSNTTAGYPLAAIPNSAFANSNWTTTTFALPPAPVTPYAVTGTAVSSSQINLSWTDTSSALSSYTLSRSIGDSVHFNILANLAGGVTTYSDNSLFGHQTYYYKLTAAGPGGTSASTAAMLVTTKDNLPVIASIAQTQYVRYGTTKTIPVSTTDADGDTVIITAANLPGFATLTSTGTDLASLTFIPVQANAGTYPGITVTANDNHGGIVTDTINLIVNNDYPPIITSIKNDTLNANSSFSFPIYATDSNTTEALTFSVTGLPGGSTVVPGPNGVDTIKLHPSFGAFGSYSPVVTVNDGNGGVSTSTFHIVVNYVSPTQSIYVQISSTDTAGFPWNYMTSPTISNLHDQYGNVTPVGLSINTPVWNVGNVGPTTGNNSGVYPDAVLKDFFIFGIWGAPQTVNVTANGLDSTKLYSITLLSASNWNINTNNGVTTYACEGQTGQLAVQNNTQNTVTFNNLTAPGGNLLFTLGMQPYSTWIGELNSVVITTSYNDGTAPLSPSGLTAQFGTNANNNSGVQLNWYDSAYNASGYQIFRSTSASGPFTQALPNTLANATSAFDSTVGSFTTYYYEVRATNSNGVSNYSNVVSVTTPDKVPSLNPIANIDINYNQSATVAVTTNANNTNPVTLTATGLPPFASFTDNGNGTGTLNVNPSPGTIGSFQNITITSTDQADSIRTQTFGIYVSDPSVISTYIHFSDGIQLGQFPWNNYTYWPGAGYNLQNLVNDQNVTTGLGITFTNGMGGNYAGGMQPHNGAGIYPDPVMRSGEFENTSKVDTIMISGLSSANMYNFVFFNSIDYGGSGQTDFSINGTTVTLNPNYNINKTVRINHIAPNGAGQVRIAVSKANSSQSYAFINDLIVESYVDTPTKVLSPIGLIVTGMTRSSVSLLWQTRSYNQTALQVWRGTDSTGSSYTLIATLPATASTYKDSTVTPNANYFYMVSAVDGSTSSNFSNAVQATPYAYAVYMNYSVLNASAPWNNLLYVPNQGFTWPNNFFVDDKGALTNTGLVETGLWAGEGTFGMNTGNNSGVVPDAVMQDAYVVFPGQTGSVQITGLDINLTYDLTVFGSSDFYEDQNGLYTANGKTCLLNAQTNTTGTLTMYGVQPDATGSISLSVTPGTATSQYGILNSVVLQGHSPYVAGNTPTQPAGAVIGNDAIQANAATLTNAVDTGLAAKNLNVYPNPIRDYFTLVVPANGGENVQVSIFNVAGQISYKQEFNNLLAGNNYFQINTTSSMTARGVYFVKVVYGDNKTVKVFKLLKE